MRKAILGVTMAIGLGTAALAADRPVVKPFTPPPPAGPQYFLWIEGGYSHFDLARTHAFDVGPASPRDPVFFDLDDGWYGRGEAGFVPAQRLGWIDAVSLFIGYRSGSADERAGGNGVAIAYQTPAQISTSERLPGAATADQDFDLFDIQLRLKHAPAAWPGLTVNVEPFFARARQDVSASVTPDFQKRTARIEGDVYGVQGAIEGRRAWTDRITLRGRASLGAYYTNADGDFTFRPFADSSDSYSRDFGGVRAGAEVGLDFAIAPSLMLGVTAGVDYWSKMPTARLTEIGAPAGPNLGINISSFTDYFVGARLTFVTGAR